MIIDPKPGKQLHKPEGLWESLKWLLGRRSEVKLQLIHGFKIYMRWVLPGLFIAAIMEAFLTPLIAGIVNGT